MVMYDIFLFYLAHHGIIHNTTDRQLQILIIKV